MYCVLKSGARSPRACSRRSSDVSTLGNRLRSYFQVSRLTFCCLGLLTLLFLQIEPASALVQCTGVPHNEGGAGEETWAFELSSSPPSCSNAAPNPTNGFEIITSDDSLFVEGVFGSVGNDFSSCTVTSDNPVGIDDIDGSTSNCNVGGVPEFDSAVNQTYTFTLKLVGETDGITYTVVIKMTATDGANHMVSSISVTGGAFGPATPGPSARDRTNITDALFNAFNQSGGGIFETDGSSIFGAGGVNGNGISFVPSALSLGAAPVSDDPFDRQFGSLKASRTGERNRVTTNAGFDFRLDLNALRGQARAKAMHSHGLPGKSGHVHALAGQQRTYKGAMAQPSHRFNAWVSGKHVDFDDDQQNADRSGYIWRVTSGMSYRVGERTTVGAFGRVRQGEVDSTALQSSLDSDFYGGGLFGVFQSDSGARLLLSGLYETSDSDIIIQGVTGSFDADQWTVEAAIDKRFTMGRSWIEPSAKVFYTEADRDGYVDSAGNQIAGSTLTLGRFTAGPKIGTTITGGGKHIAEIRPYAKVSGAWDFESEGDFALSTGAVFATSDRGINLGGGVEVEFLRGTTVTLAGDWFGTNTELESWSVSGAVGTSFAALGLANVASMGLVSLDFAASAEDQSAKAKVAIPLN